MDERKIAELFEDAVPTPPPPSFGPGEVAAESARLTRRRNRVLGGTALGVLVVTGVATAALTIVPQQVSGNDSAAAAAPVTGSGNATAAPNEVPSSGEPRVLTVPTGPEAPPSNSSPETSLQGGGSGGGAGESGGTPRGCGSVDRELAAALAGELPAPTATSGSFVASPLTCPAGASSGAVAAQNGPNKGVVSILLAPAGAQLAQPPWGDRPQGTIGVVVPARSGKVLVVSQEPLAGSDAPPLDDAALRTIGEKLAAGL
ncbi:hypothetical protein [Actinokineospora bangkokensis]|uniref:Uncharacterized protein n=1 Tax=Actinokineospora bangkokensis TaxID=1193682 RepID=A0A1Q9LFT6_9PSEU|nr:hypothetical protein [Actinokineospora bangkokensis]OLR90896.1 hypothetical protein BJP25_30530 [Actinokineospora bangkokensis]